MKLSTLNMCPWISNIIKYPEEEKAAPAAAAVPSKKKMKEILEKVKLLQVNFYILRLVK